MTSHPAVVPDVEADIYWRSGILRTALIAGLALSLVAFHIATSGNLWAQVPGAAGHNQLTEVACVDVPSDVKRPEFGCFNVGMVTGLHFGQPSVYRHLRTFPNRKAAEAAKSATGIVVEEDGRFWLSEFGRGTVRQGKDICRPRRTSGASLSHQLRCGPFSIRHAARR